MHLTEIYAITTCQMSKVRTVLIYMIISDLVPAITGKQSRPGTSHTRTGHDETEMMTQNVLNVLDTATGRIRARSLQTAVQRKSDCNTRWIWLVGLWTVPEGKYAFMGFFFLLHFPFYRQERWSDVTAHLYLAGHLKTYSNFTFTWPAHCIISTSIQRISLPGVGANRPRTNCL